MGFSETKNSILKELVASKKSKDKLISMNFKIQLEKIGNKQGKIFHKIRK